MRVAPLVTDKAYMPVRPRESDGECYASPRWPRNGRVEKKKARVGLLLWFADASVAIRIAVDVGVIVEPIGARTIDAAVVDVRATVTDRAVIVRLAPSGAPGGVALSVPGIGRRCRGRN